MSVPNTVSPPEPAVVDPFDSGDRDMARARAGSRRRWLVFVLRVLLAVFIVGGWEISTRLEWVDVFFFGQPSGIAAQLVKWAQNGTAQGPLWEQIVVTLEETILGFLIGVVLGIIFGVCYGVIYALATFVDPKPREITVTIPPDKFVKQPH